MIWNLAEAKSRFSEVVNLALTEGPQTITRHKDTVVLMSAERYAELIGEKPDFKEFLFEEVGLEELDLSRDKSPMREVDL
jgi:antitoxin Phd